MELSLVHVIRQIFDYQVTPVYHSYNGFVNLFADR